VAVISCSGGAAHRDVVNVIVDFRQVLTDARPEDCPDVAAEYLCELFEGSAAALNLMDYTNVRFHTIRNVGSLVPSERSHPVDEYYPFSDFPFSAQQLGRGAAYRASVGDAHCAPEYRELLGAMRRTDCMGAPIRLHGRAVGELWVSRDSGREFTEADEDLAVACGATLARFFRPTWAAAS
jgi:hypothetical protein